MEKIHLYGVKSEKETAKPIKTELEKRDKKKKKTELEYLHNTQGKRYRLEGIVKGFKYFAKIKDD